MKAAQGSHFRPRMDVRYATMASYSNKPEWMVLRRGASSWTVSGKSASFGNGRNETSAPCDHYCAGARIRPSPFVAPPGAQGPAHLPVRVSIQSHGVVVPSDSMVRTVYRSFACCPMLKPSKRPVRRVIGRLVSDIRRILYRKLEHALALSP